MKQYIKKIGFAKTIQITRYFVSAVSPELATRMIFRVSMDRKLNTNNPQTLDEHISTLKIKSIIMIPWLHNALTSIECVSISHNLIDGILNELLGVYKHEDDIPWSQLPDQFVVKWNNACGANLIVPQKDALDIKGKKTVRKMEETKAVVGSCRNTIQEHSSKNCNRKVFRK